ncbi:hypothetical protein ACFL59_02545 [Planctomycetota bacterium]
MKKTANHRLRLPATLLTAVLAAAAATGCGNEEVVKKAEADARVAQAEKEKAQEEKTTAERSLAAQVAEIAGLKDQLQKLKDQVAAIDAARTAALELKDKTAAEYEAYKVRVASLETQAKQQSEAVQKAVAEKRKALESEYAAKEQALSQKFAGEKNALAQRATAAEAKVAQLNTNVAELKQTIDRLEATIRAMKFGGR